MRKPILMMMIAIGATWLAGCSNDGGSMTAPNATLRRVTPSGVEATKFVAVIDNKYLPLKPGVARTYRSETPDGVEVTVDEATSVTKTIQNVVTTVVHNTVSLDGDLIEETFEWYAQDEDGNVWYFGEDTKTYENGQFLTDAGSWEAGKNGAQAGIIMLADPHPGDQYIEENAPGVAVDEARVVSLSKTADVPYGSFDDCLETKDFTRLEHGVSEFKLYAQGVGLIQERDAAHNVAAQLISVE